MNEYLQLGVGISKPIQYFESKTAIFDIRSAEFFLLGDVKLGQFEYIS